MAYEAPVFFDLMEYVAGTEHDVIDMVSGNPDWGSPPGIARGLREYAELGGEAYQYPPTEGLRALREEIAARRDVAVEQIVVTVGGGEANYLAMAAGLECHSGNTVVLTDPVYPYYPGKVSMLGGSVRYLEANRDGSLSPDRIRNVMDDTVAAIVVNSPNNPTGAVYDEETIETCVREAEAHDAMVVSDEAYDHLVLSGSFTSVLGVDSPNRILTTSFSKTFAITGFRVGYAVFPTVEMARLARDRHMLTVTAGVRPSQYAVLTALESTSFEYFEDTRSLLRERVETFGESLATIGGEYSLPDGGFYVMVKFPGFPGTMENVKRLIDGAGVAGMPGDAFGESREEWFRFALVTDRVSEAGDRLVDFFESNH